MRISDWSSDVCSSDLWPTKTTLCRDGRRNVSKRSALRDRKRGPRSRSSKIRRKDQEVQADYHDGADPDQPAEREPPCQWRRSEFHEMTRDKPRLERGDEHDAGKSQDRKSIAEGKRVAVRVEP